MTKFVKSIAGLMTVAMVLSAVVVPVGASAQTVSDLQAMIATLQAQIAALSGQTGNVGTTFTFTTNLQVGSRNESVRQLQVFLNSDPDTMVALTGVGSAGNESNYFGTLTKSAVIRFQKKYGIMPSVGYVGPLTRAKLNSMSGPNPTPGPNPNPTPAMDGTDGSLTVGSSSVVSGAVTIKKGETKDIIAAQLTASAGKVTVNRFDVQFSERPWLTFSKIELVDNNTGNVIATKNLSSASDVTEVTVGSNYLARMEGLNYVVTPGQSQVVKVRGTLLAGSDKVTGQTITVTLPTNGIRTVNGKGYTDTVGPSVALTSSVTLTSTGSQGNIVIRTSPSSPAPRIVNTSTSGQTNDVVLGVFDLKSENQSSTLNTLRFTLNSPVGPAFSTMFKNLRITDGTNTYNADSVATTSTFSNLNIAIPLDSWKTLTLKADVADQDDFASNSMASSSIVAQVTTSSTMAGVTGVDANYNSVTASGGNTSASNNVTFLAGGATVSNLSASSVKVANGDSAPVKSLVKFMFTMNNTGTSDLYVSKNTNTALGTTTTVWATTTLSVVTTSPSTDSGDTASVWRIPAGTSRAFTYEGDLNNTGATGGLKESKITTIYFGDDTSNLQESSINFGLEALRVTELF